MASIPEITAFVAAVSRALFCAGVKLSGPEEVPEHEQRRAATRLQKVIFISIL
jgi:hypothetical protein